MHLFSMLIKSQEKVVIGFLHVSLAFKIKEFNKLLFYEQLAFKFFDFNKQAAYKIDFKHVCNPDPLWCISRDPPQLLLRTTVDVICRLATQQNGLHLKPFVLLVK